MFAFSPVIGLSILVTWIVMMVLTRYVSLSSMVAGLVLVLTAAWQFWWQDGVLSVADGMALGLLFLIFALVVYKHRSNIVRLCNGTEPKAFSKKSK
jgi:glycerol-3-phosphate acyltransferase PlsY